MAKLFEGTTESLEILLDGSPTTEWDWKVAYTTTSSHVPNGEANRKGNTNGTTAVTVIPAGGDANDRHKMQSLSIYNADNSPASFTLRENNSSSYTIICKVQLQAGESFLWDCDGWGTQTTTGAAKSDASSSGAPTDAEYWVSAAHASLSAEHVITTKAHLEGRLSDVSDLAEADGDTYSGTHDFGGATLEMPNGTLVTLSKTGQFALDTDGAVPVTATPIVSIYSGGTTYYLFPINGLPSSDNDVMAYDSATNAITWQSQPGGGGNAFTTVSVSASDVGYTWSDTGGADADSATDTLTFIEGQGLDLDVDGTLDAIRFALSLQNLDTYTVGDLERDADLIGVYDDSVSAHRKLTPDELIVDSIPMFLIREVQSNGTAGGSSVATTWTTRTLNSEVTDTHNIVSVSSNLISIPAGRWLLFGWSPAYKTDSNICRFYNSTDSTEIERSWNWYTNDTQNEYSVAQCVAIVDFSATKDVALQYHVGVAQATNGLGINNAASGNEVYGTVLGVRIGQP